MIDYIWLLVYVYIILQLLWLMRKMNKAHKAERLKLLEELEESESQNMALRRVLKFHDIKIKF